jgi:FdhD protein
MALKQIKIWNFKEKNEGILTNDFVALEQPLEIIISYPEQDAQETISWMTTMRTPGQDINLITGLLYSENIIKAFDDLHFIKLIDEKEENTYQVFLKSKPAINLQQRNHLVNSSCGVCGKTSIDQIRQHIIFTPKRGHPKFAQESLFRLSNSVENSMPTFNKSGGIHACGLFDLEGNIKAIFEDVGRHNALDKLIGHLVANEKIPLTNFGLFLSGRASFELVQKGAMVGIPFIVSVGAPSSLAIEMADECGITLAGFLKTKSFNIYTYPERIG